MKEVIARLKEHQSPTPSKWRKTAIRATSHHIYEIMSRSVLRNSQINNVEIL